jgi:hypothetical protein
MRKSMRPDSVQIVRGSITTGSSNLRLELVIPCVPTHFIERNH